MFIEFKLSKDFKRRAMDVLPTEPQGADFKQVFAEGALIDVWFPSADRVICRVETGNCLGRLMRAVNESAASWYDDYTTGEHDGSAK